MPAFFPIFETLLKLLFRFFFYLLNRSKTLSLHRCLQFWDEEKISRGQVRWIRHDNGFVFGQKLTDKHRCVSWCVIMVQNPWLVFTQFCAFLTNSFAQSAHNFQIIFRIDRTTLWQKFIMHHAIAIEENSEQNLHIWRNLMCFFRPWLFWTLALGWLGFSFNVIGIHPWFVAIHPWFVWANLDHRWTSSPSPERCPATLPTSSATSLIVIRLLSKIIFFTASMWWASLFTFFRPSLNRLYQTDRFLSNISWHLLLDFLAEIYFLFRFVADVWDVHWTLALRLIGQQTTY